MDQKQIKIIQKYKSWEVIRIGDPKRGDYLIARLFDEMSTEVFVDSMIKRGFVLLQKEEDLLKPVERHVFTGTVSYNGDDDEYFYALDDGTIFNSNTFTLFEELDNLLQQKGIARSNVGDRLTIIFDRKKKDDQSDETIIEF